MTSNVWETAQSYPHPPCRLCRDPTILPKGRPLQTEYPVSDHVAALLCPHRGHVSMPNGNQPDAVRAPDTACFLNGLLNRFDLFIGDMEDHVRVGRAARMGQSLLHGRHRDRVGRLDLEGDYFHGLAGQVTVGPDREADQIRPGPPAAGRLAPSAAVISTVSGIDLALLGPECSSVS